MFVIWYHQTTYHSNIGVRLKKMSHLRPIYLRAYVSVSLIQPVKLETWRSFVCIRNFGDTSHKLLFVGKESEFHLTDHSTVPLVVKFFWACKICFQDSTWKSEVQSTSKSAVHSTCNYFVNGHYAHVEVHRVNLAMEPKLFKQRVSR
jgi:hypothetical protein